MNVFGEPERVVGLTVATAVEAMPPHPSGGGFEGRDAAELRERCFVAESVRVVAGGDQQDGQGTTAVGRTEAIRGRFVLDGTTVRSGAFTVDLREESSDREARDQQFQDRIMATADFPTATFRLVAPFTLRRLPADLTTVRVSAVRGMALLRLA